MYTGGGKTREVEHGKDLSGQLHSSKFLAAFAVSVPCRYDSQEPVRENKNGKTGGCVNSLCRTGCCSIGSALQRRRTSFPVSSWNYNSGAVLGSVVCVRETRSGAKRFVTVCGDGTACRVLPTGTGTKCGVVLSGGNIASSGVRCGSRGDISGKTNTEVDL